MFSLTFFTSESPEYSVQKLTSSPNARMNCIADSVTSLDCEGLIKCGVPIQYYSLQPLDESISLERKFFDLSTIKQQLTTSDIIVLDVKLCGSLKLSFSNIRNYVDTSS